MQTLQQQRAHYEGVRARLYAPPKPKPVPAPKVVEPAPQKPPPLGLTADGVVVRDVLHVSSERYIRETPGDVARKIAREVCARHGLAKEDLFSDRRQKHLVLARHELCWRLRQETTWSIPRIGRFVGRDHTTVLHSIRVYQNYLEGKS